MRLCLWKESNLNSFTHYMSRTYYLHPRQTVLGGAMVMIKQRKNCSQIHFINRKTTDDAGLLLFRDSVYKK